MTTAKRPARSELETRAVKILAWMERGVFFFIGTLLFVVALVLLVRSALLIVPMVQVQADVIGTGTAFLDLILLVLMVVELAYTVLLSLRGAVLVAEPFLIVGLIAVIRRILVITVGEVKNGGPSVAGNASLLELGVLTGVVLAFVVSILLLRVRARDKSLDVFAEDD